MTQKELAAALSRIVTSKKAKELYVKADEMSAALTKHGEPHALGVMNFGVALASEIESYFPGTFTPEELTFTIPASCYGHDIGRSEPEDIVNGKKKDRHEAHGARIMNALMKDEGIPGQWRRPVVYGIVNHRANGVLGRDALAPQRRGAVVAAARLVVPSTTDVDSDPRHDIARRTLAVTVLADKCVGDAERVRKWDAFKLHTLRSTGLSRWYFHKYASEDHKNDAANYAIKHADILVDPNDSGNDPRYRGAIILKLDMDFKVCTLEDIFTVKWFREAYHCCGKSAQALGFVFRIEANGQTWFFSKEKMAWAKRPQIGAPRVNG